MTGKLRLLRLIRRFEHQGVETGQGVMQMVHGNVTDQPLKLPQDDAALLGVLDALDLLMGVSRCDVRARPILLVL